MKKMFLGFLAMACLSGGVATANSEDVSEVGRFPQPGERIYTLYVGRGYAGRRKCFSYQGRNVIVEGDMSLHVYRAVYWTDGNCDLYY